MRKASIHFILLFVFVLSWDGGGMAKKIIERLAFTLQSIPDMQMF